MTSIEIENRKTDAPAPLDDETSVLPPPRVAIGRRVAQVLVPIASLLVAIALWHIYVTVNEVPHYLLPSPVLVAQSLYDHGPVLLLALLVTLQTTFFALFFALVGGVAFAILISQSRFIELAASPYAVILQVTPVVSLAPLVVVYAPTAYAAVLIVAFIVAFFPVFSNTLQGLKSTDHNLLNLFELYGANRLQTLLLLKIPNALPTFVVGLKIAGGLSLIGAVVAEFVAGSAGPNSGLAFRLLESQFRLLIPRMFASMLLLMLTGVLIYSATSLVAYLLLRKWHESAVRREN